MLDTDIQERIGQFKADLLRHDDETMIQRYFEHDTEPYCMDNRSYFDLKKSIGTQYTLELKSVFMVGSGKLGFSIKPGHEFRPFGDNSDVDLAIVSSGLFEKVWGACSLYSRQRGQVWADKKKFCSYLLQGWIRPDLLPIGMGFPMRNEWWDFFQGLTNAQKYGPYKIRAGLYYSSFFLHEYQKACLLACRDMAREGGILGED